MTRFSKLVASYKFTFSVFAVIPQPDQSNELWNKTPNDNHFWKSADQLCHDS